MTDAEIAALRAQLAGARLPWRTQGGCNVYDAEGSMATELLSCVDAELVAAGISALPMLLDVLEAARGLRASLDRQDVGSFDASAYLAYRALAALLDGAKGATP